MKTHSHLLFAIIVLLSTASFAQNNAPTAIELRVMQTRTFNTTDFEQVVNALNDAARSLNFTGESKVITTISKDMASYGCVPYHKNGVDPSSGNIDLLFMNCLMRRLPDNKGISVRLILGGIVIDIHNKLKYSPPADPAFYQKVFDKMGGAMFMNAQKIEPAELQ